MESRIIESLKRFVMKWFELFVIVSLLGIVVLINFVVVNKIAFLNFYYLPTLVAAYVLGRKTGITAAVASVSLVVLSVILAPSQFELEATIPKAIYWNVSIWAGFLIITGYVVGSLYEEKQQRIEELKEAYEGILEILSKYIDAIDRYTKGHSVRVSEYAMEIAIAMGLQRYEVENIRVAALLHDIGKIEISTDVIRKAADLTDDEKLLMGSHTEKGARLLQSMGGLLKEVVPLVVAHHKYYADPGEAGPESHENIPLGARIIAVADAYDAITTDRPYRTGKPPWQAIEEIEKSSGTQFDPKIVDAFRRVIANKIEEEQLVR
jgi:putative nucleotidyltransferase with HDIG domain